VSVTPFSLRDAPALIERVFPSQKVSAESYKEQMAVQGKTLTALGSYWKGRKPLVLNKAVILASLLPATDDLERDLHVFDLLMGMDDGGLAKRLPLRSRSSVASLGVRRFASWFGRVRWSALRTSRVCSTTSGRSERSPRYQRHSMPELVEQLGIMRFGHRPRFADVFSGSGQIPFEAARLGLETFASDLNPIACMLTWGAFNVVGAAPEVRATLSASGREARGDVQAEVDSVGV
jgi:putative DNA methylase